jgi:hypothetical protein
VSQVLLGHKELPEQFNNALSMLRTVFHKYKAQYSLYVVKPIWQRMMLK